MKIEKLQKHLEGLIKEINNQIPHKIDKVEYWWDYYLKSKINVNNKEIIIEFSKLAESIFYVIYLPDKYLLKEINKGALDNFENFKAFFNIKSNNYAGIFYGDITHSLNRDSYEVIFRGTLLDVNNIIKSENFNKELDRVLE